MRRRLLGLGLSDTIPDLFWRGGEGGSESLRELLRRRILNSFGSSHAEKFSSMGTQDMARLADYRKRHVDKCG